MRTLYLHGLALMLGLLPLTAAHGAETAPDALVKSTTDEVLATIRQTRDQRELMHLAQDKVVPHFDFERMTRLAVGRPWTQANPEQQQALQKEFRELLVRTYTRALATGSNKDVKVTVKPGSQSSGNETTVKTQVVQSGEQPVAIDYQMEKTPDGWKVYDIVVESVSLVTSYRSTFAEAVAKSGIDGLIKNLADKNASLVRS